MKKQISESKVLRELLTTDEGVRYCQDRHGLKDTTVAVLTLRRSHGLEPKFMQRGRAIFYRKQDLDDWCKKRIVERAQAAARKSAGRD